MKIILMKQWMKQLNYMIADKQMKCCVCKIEIDNGMDFHNPAPIGKYTSDVCFVKLDEV